MKNASNIGAQISFTLLLVFYYVFNSNRTTVLYSLIAISVILFIISRGIAFSEEVDKTSYALPSVVRVFILGIVAFLHRNLTDKRAIVFVGDSIIVQLFSTLVALTSVMSLGIFLGSGIGGTILGFLFRIASFSMVKYDPKDTSILGKFLYMGIDNRTQKIDINEWSGLEKGLVGLLYVCFLFI